MKKIITASIGYLLCLSFLIPLLCGASIPVVGLLAAPFEYFYPNSIERDILVYIGLTIGTLLSFPAAHHFVKADR